MGDRLAAVWTLAIGALLLMLSACSPDPAEQTCGGGTANEATCPTGYACVPNAGEPIGGHGVCRKTD